MKNKEMDTKKCECCEHKHHSHNYGGGNSGNAIYGLGVIGALFYFLQNVSGIEAVLMGIGKAVFWPAILMFKLLTYLQI
ncbi:MAG: hypothetical protein WA152_02315 [Microgenomates group bacterium]